MPVEIRELIIKTEISVSGRNNNREVSERELKAFKRQLLEECRKIITDNNRKGNHKR